MTAAALVAHDVPSLHRGLATLAPELRGRAARLLGVHGSAASAEDLVQDTIERALRFAAQYERGTNLRAWVHQILFSVFVTRYRRARRERVALRSLSEDPSSWTMVARFRAPEVAAGLSPAARRALEALPTSYREAVELVDVGGATYREASEALGVPLGTVMSRLHRARRLLEGPLAA